MSSVTIAAFAVIAIIIIISWLCSRGRTPEPAPKRLENNEQMPLPDSMAYKDRNISELQSKWKTINWFSKDRGDKELQEALRRNSGNLERAYIDAIKQREQETRRYD